MKRILLKKMIVIAPADGMVEGVTVHAGTLVSGGATVATFYSNERVVVAKVGEENIAKVKIGDPARVQLLTFPGKDFDAGVAKILPFADPETRRYDVHLKVNATSAQLLPNSTGEVIITVGNHDDVLLIPRRAIFNGINGTFVYVVQDGRIEKRQIELGYRGLTTAEATQGLAAGEKVVVESLDQFRDGQRVRIGSNP
jgi:RND family efflux transporter MFP subunit